MKDEIIDLLQYLKNVYESEETSTWLNKLQIKDLLDYITNLQEENEMYKKEKDALMNSLFITRNKYNNDKARYRRKAKNYKARIDKAVDMLNLIIPELWNISNAMTYKIQDVRRVLQGKSDE